MNKLRIIFTKITIFYDISIKRSNDEQGYIKVCYRIDIYLAVCVRVCESLVKYESVSSCHRIIFNN